MLILCWTSCGWRLFPKSPLYTECKMLLWGYQLVAQCGQMCSKLIKTFCNCPAELFWNTKDFLQTSSVSYSGLGTCSLTTLPCCGTLHARGVVWYSSMAAAWPACCYYVQCKRWRRGCGVLQCVLCFLPQGSSGKSLTGPTQSHVPPSLCATCSAWGCVMDLWACGILCSRQLSMRYLQA